MTPAATDAVPDTRTPRALVRSVLIFACLGYAALIVTVLALVAAMAGLLVVAAEAHVGSLIIWALVLAGLMWTVLAAAFQPMPVPQGQEIDRSDAPRLFDLLDAVRAATEGPELHRVVVTSDLNAAIVQVSRPGLVFGARNHMVIGLPLLGALTPQEATAVLAHEYGHLRGAHGRIGAFIHRSRITWLVLLERLEEREARSAVVARAFVAWYAPRLAARSMTLARTQEYEADRAAARATSPADIARSLLRLHIAERFVDETFWTSLAKLVEDVAEPPAHILSAATRAASEASGWPEAQTAARAALAEPADPRDVHPSLAQRLAALGVGEPETVAAVLEAPGETALQRFLGAGAAPLLSWMDGEWTSANAQAWRARHAELVAARARVAEIDALPAGERGPDLEAEAARHLWYLDDNDDAEERARRVLDLVPRHPQAHVVLGHVLLERGDDVGLDHLSAGMVEDRDLTVEACATAIGYLERAGRGGEAEPFHRTLMRFAERTEAAGEDAPRLDAGDPVGPHGLDPATVDRIRAGMDAITPLLARAYLVARVAPRPGEARHVLLLVPEGHWGRFWRDGVAEMEEITARVAAALPAEPPVDVLIAPVTGPLLERVAAVPGALVHGAPR